jgi:hypothetical protein
LHPPPFHPVTQSVKGPYFSVVGLGSKASVDKRKKDNLPSVDVRRTNPSRKKKIFQQPLWMEPFVEQRSKDRSIGGLSPIRRTDPPMERTSRRGWRPYPPPPSHKTPFHPVTQSVKGPYFSVVSFRSKPSAVKRKKDNPSRKKENIPTTFLEGRFSGKRIQRGLPTIRMLGPFHFPPSHKTPFHPVTQSVKGPYFSVVSFRSKPSAVKRKKDNPSRKKENIPTTFLEGTFCGTKNRRIDRWEDCRRSSGGSSHGENFPARLAAVPFSSFPQDAFPPGNTIG